MKFIMPESRSTLHLSLCKLESVALVVVAAACTPERTWLRWAWAFLPTTILQPLQISRKRSKMKRKLKLPPPQPNLPAPINRKRLS